MKFKPVPAPPESLAFVRDAQRAVPLVPEDTDDCCARLLDRVDLPGRDAARTWLTFLRALELVEETDAGYRRRRIDPEPAALRRAFRERVVAADAVLDALADADAPLDADATFERVVDRVPTWERHRSAEWEARWRDRVARLLGWCVLLGLAERVDGGYVAVDPAGADSN